MTSEQIIRAAIPGADADTVEHIVWGRTPAPCGAVTTRDLYRAASRFRRATEKGLTLCDHCDNIAVDEFTCDACARALCRPRYVGANV